MARSSTDIMSFGAELKQVLWRSVPCSVIDTHLIQHRHVTSPVSFHDVTVIQIICLVTLQFHQQLILWNIGALY